MPDPHPHVVIVGGGFAGLQVAKRLARSQARVTLIDRRNHHIFQPLLYQVATAALSPANIAAPIRKILRAQANCEVVLGEVKSVDTGRRLLKVAGYPKLDLPYDYLVLGTGVTHAYFGNEHWAPLAPGLKTIEDAIEIRRRFLLAFEAAEVEGNLVARRAALTFVVVGGGPTGVETAGAMAEIAHTAIPRDFRDIDTKTARIILVEAQDRVLPAFPKACSASAKRQLEKLGIEVMLDSRVTDIDDRSAEIERAGSRERIGARNIIWAAGVRASSLGATLGAPTDDAGRVLVEPDLSVPGRPEVFVVGDLAHVDDDRFGIVPGVAPAAVQMGRFAAGIIARELSAKRRGASPPDRPSFAYADRGMLATIGRNKAVAHLAGHSFGGRIAWLLWALVHVMFLIGFRNRILVMLEWTWMYVFYDRGARLITGDSRIDVLDPRED